MAKTVYRESPAIIRAWLPAFDTYDGTENFWRRYELSRLTEDQKEVIKEQLDDLDELNGNWQFVWAVSVYYSILFVGGEEAMP